MFYAFGGSKTVVKHTFFHHDLDMRYTKTLTGTKQTKKTKPLDAPNIDRHQKNQKKQKFQQLPRSGPIVPGNFSFFGFFWCLCRFGASSGLFFLFFLVPVQVW